jgi:hypothetical protein
MSDLRRAIAHPVALILLISSLPITSAAGSGPTFSNRPSLPAALEPPFSTNVKLSEDSMKVNAETTVASDTRGNLYAGWVASNSTGIGCGFSGSQDGGRTWSKVEYSRIWSGAAGDPVVVADERGNLYRLCVSGFGNWWNEISKSSDGGRTWTAWTRFSGGDHPWFVVRGGVIHYFSGSNPQNSGSLYIRSSDDGKTWSKGVEINPVWVGRMTIDAKGGLYVANQDNNDFWFSKSTDGGATWTGGVIFRMAGLVGPEIEVSPDGKDVYIVNQGNDWKIEFRHSGDGGATWDPPVDAVPVDQTWNAERPSIARDCAGTLHLAWVWKKSADFQDAAYASSRDNGRTWSAPVRISDPDPTGGIGMALHYTKLTLTPQGHVVYVWDEARSGKQHAWSSSAPVAATCGGLERIEVNPGQGSVAVGQTLQFSAAGYDRNNSPIPITPAWSVSGGKIGQNGLFTPDKVGSFTVTASDGGVTGTASVSVAAGALSRIRVDPPSATITADETLAFSASGEDSGGNPVPVSVQWSASGGSVDGSGNYVPDRAGTFSVTARQGAVSGSANVTVTPGKLVELEIRPGTATVAADATLAFEALGRDVKGNEGPVSASWSVGGGAGGGAIDASGLYMPQKTGEWEVLAAAAGMSSKATVTVVPGKVAVLSLSPASAAMIVGETLAFAATATDSKGNEVPDPKLQWSVARSIGRVSAAGEFTASSAGAGKVRAAAQGAIGEIAAEASVSVRQDWSWLLPLILVGVAAVAGIAAASAMSRRRRRDEERRRLEQTQQRQAWGGGFQ